MTDKIAPYNVRSQHDYCCRGASLSHCVNTMVDVSAIIDSIPRWRSRRRTMDFLRAEWGEHYAGRDGPAI
jgi:hypothetical protein